MQVKTYALTYCKMGLHVIPIKGPYGEDYDDSKKPLVDWKIYQDRRPTEQDIIQWFAKWPDANIALITGPKTNLLDLDIDKDTGGFESLKGKHLPKSWIVRTPTEGLHYYFTWPKELADIATTKRKIYPGLDVRGNGGYVVAPPSPGFDGSQYSWEGTASFRNCALAAPPQWLTDRLIETGLKPLGQGEYIPDTANHWLCEVWDGLPGGQGIRRPAYVKLLSYFFGKKCSPEFVHKLLKEWNLKNDPPMEDSKFDKDFQDILDRFKSGQYKTSLTVDEQDNIVAEDTGPEIELKTTHQSADEFLKHLEWRASKPAIELPFGFKKLDDLTQGLWRKNLDTIGALTKGGKTLFLLNVLYNNILKGNKVLYFPTEMPEHEILQRYFAITHGIPIKELQSARLSPESKEALKEAVAKFKESEFHLVQNHQPTLRDIIKSCEKAKPDVLVIDYIQHVRLDMANKTRALEQFVMDLKAFISDSNINCLITAQPSKAKRDFHKGGRIMPMTIHDFADSSIIEKESSRIILIHPGPKKEKDRYRNIEVEITNRHGDSGTVQLMFDSIKARFIDAE